MLQAPCRGKASAVQHVALRLNVSHAQEMNEVTMDILIALGLYSMVSRQ